MPTPADLRRAEELWRLNDDTDRLVGPDFNPEFDGQKGKKKMPITKKQREIRRGYICASDLPAMYGVDLYGRTAADVIAEKQHGTADEPSDAMRRGNIMERTLIEWGVSELNRCEPNRPWKVRHNIARVSPCKSMRASLDAVLLRGDSGDAETIEAKLVGSPAVRDLYGDAGTDEVPHAVKLQCYAQLYCGGFQASNIVAAFSLHDWRLYRIERTAEVEELLRQIAADARRWKRRFLEERLPYDGSQPMSMDVIRRLVRVPNKVAAIDPSLVEAYQVAAEVAANATEVKERAKEAMLSALGDAQVGIAGRQVVEFFPVSKKAYTVKASVSPRLAIKENKGQYDTRESESAERTYCGRGSLADDGDYAGVAGCADCASGDRHPGNDREALPAPRPDIA